MSSVKPPFGTKLNLIHPLLRDLVGWYEFNELSGKFLNDLTNNKNLGTAINGPTWGGSLNGGALNFSGGDQYVSAGPSLGNKLGDGIGELSVYVKFKVNTTSSNDGLFGLGSLIDSDNGEFTLFVISNRIYWRMYGTVSFTAFTDFTDTVLEHNLVSIYTGSNAIMYLDGVEVINDAHSSDLNLDGVDTNIGIYQRPTQGLDGRISRCGIWNRVIQPFEVQQLINLPDDVFLLDSPIFSKLDVVITQMSMSDTIEFSDSASQAAAADMNMADTMEFSDTFSNTVTALMSLADNIEFSDTAQNIAALLMSLSDNVTFSDQVLIDGAINLTMNAGFTLSDAVSQVVAAVMGMEDGLILSDIVSLNTGILAEGPVTISVQVKQSKFDIVIKQPKFDIEVN